MFNEICNEVAARWIASRLMEAFPMSSSELVEYAKAFNHRPILLTGPNWQARTAVVIEVMTDDQIHAKLTGQRRLSQDEMNYILKRFNAELSPEDLDYLKKHGLI